MSEDLNPLLKVIKTLGVKFFTLKEHRLVCLYDDDIYSNIDYDFVSNQHRSLIRRALLQEKWEELSSRSYQKNGFYLTLPKASSTLGTDPSDVILEELNRTTEDSFVFCTPTQSLLVMLKQDLWDQNLAKEMIQKCPANIDKIYQWMKEYGSLKPTKAQLEELKKIQRANFDKKVLARKKSGL